MDKRRTSEEAIVLYESIIRSVKERKIGPTVACKEHGIKYGAFVSWHRRQVQKGLSEPLNLRGVPATRGTSRTVASVQQIVVAKRPYNKKTPTHQTKTVTVVNETITNNRDSAEDMIYEFAFKAGSIVNLLNKMLTNQKSVEFFAKRGIDIPVLKQAKDALVRLTYS